MIGNIIILILAIALIVAVVTIFINIKREKNDLYTLTLLVLLLFGGCSIIYPNTSWISSPMTPEVHGKVVNDAGEPVRDMFIVIKWVVRSTEFPYHGYSNTSDVVVVSTDKEGAFTAGRKLKPISFALPPLFYREYDGVYIFTVDNRYECAAEKVANSGKILLRLHKITTRDQLLNNYHKYDSDWRNGNTVEANDLMTKYKEAAIKLIYQNCRR